MRIALLSWESKHSVAVGGLAEHVTELSAALTRLGHEIHLFTRIALGQSGYENIAGVHYHRCPYESHADFLADNQRMCDSFVWHLAETECFLGAPFDLIHGHDWLVVRALEQAKHRHGRPLVMTFHSTEYGRCGNQLYEGASRRIRDLEWLGSYLAGRVICVSKSLLGEVQRLYGVPGDKMSAIYNGIDVRRFDKRVNKKATRKRFNVGVEDPMVLFAGRMTWQKGPDLLMEAMPDLLCEHPETKFVFAGEGDMRGPLEERAKRLGISRSARFVGKRGGRELVGLFKSADLVCVPSRNEPFGIVILEAWGAKKPVVATRNGGPAEFVTHEHTGLTVADRAESIRWGVDRVLSDKPAGVRLGLNGRKEAESYFSWDLIAEQTEGVYLGVLGRGGKNGDLTA